VDDFLLFMMVGFAAQLVDGAIGMAYGVISSSIMLSMGVPPAVASASVHTAEIFTTATSGLSHWRFGNVNFQLIKRLAPAGMLGGAIGAYLLSNVESIALRILVCSYLIIMGLIIIYKAMHYVMENTDLPKHIPLLGFFGGFLDAIGGGGWGPFVTSSLLGHGTAPRIAIGSTSLAEFFVTLTISMTFVFTIGLDIWPIIGGLVAGGMVAAPAAAYAAKHVPARALMFVVGGVVIVLNGYNIWKNFQSL